MISAIRNSLLGKSMSLFMALVFMMTLVPVSPSFALTGGPAQPEFNAFTPIGTSDMVDLASGDFKYNIPIMDIGGFPINLAYSSGVTTDQEASWVGLGWDLSIGQINRQMRGLPDDFRGMEVGGDEMTYEYNVKDNTTVGMSFTLRPSLAGLDNINPSIGLSAQYNSYSGMSISPSAGITYKLGGIASVGLNVSSTPDGLNISPNLSLHAKGKSNENRQKELGLSYGVSFNSRQGLVGMNLGASLSAVERVKDGDDIVKQAIGGSGNIGSSVSYVPKHYTPSVQPGLTSLNFTFNAATDAEFYTVEGGGQITAFGSTQYVAAADQVRRVKAFGYENNHLASKEDVRDFNREKDGNFSVNSTNLPITNYTYDLYSVSGQGVSGMFRPYRSQVGYVSDDFKTNGGGGLSGGVEVGGGSLFHLGADIEVSLSETEAGVWEEDNDAIEHFESAPSTGLYEEVYFKNVGDLSVDNELGIYGEHNTLAGGYQPIRLKLGGGEFEREVEPFYQSKHLTTANGHYNIPLTPIKRTQRLKRNQNVLPIKNSEITNSNGTLLGFTPNPHAKPHHTAGFIVTRNDGARYIYGEALYNTKKEEVSFAVDPDATVLCQGGLVEYEHGVNNSVNNNVGDQYYNRISTPAYGHTYLLTCLLSTDYSDIDAVPGPSEGDLGSYTKFTYTNPNIGGIYKWRVPYGENQANFNEGLRTDPEDNRGSYIYGEKETKYIDKIETKTHVAIFTISPRADGLGAIENGSTNGLSKMWKLDKIELYSRGEYYDSNGAVDPNAVPIKTAHFVYNYDLCSGVPNFIASYDTSPLDVVTDTDGAGKLTLRKVYFTYRDSKMGKYNAYNFKYGDKDHDGNEDAALNPPYNLKGYDIWGNYKPNRGGCGVMDHPTAPEFNYVDQEDNAVHDYAAAWSLTDIELPSGGKIKVDYEADDYQYVQDKKAMQMFKVVGAGENNVPDFSAFSPLDTDQSAPLNQNDNEALLYKSISNTPHEYLYVKLHEVDQVAGSGTMSTTDFFAKYVQPIITDQKGLMYFRFFTNTSRKGGGAGVLTNWKNGRFEYVTGYVELNPNSGQYNVFDHNGVDYAAIPILTSDMEAGVLESPISFSQVNPISKATWAFGRKYLQQHMYDFQNPSPNSSVGAMANAILTLINDLATLAVGPNGILRGKEIGRRFIPEKSWVRLCSPAPQKYGGGCRVKQVAMADEWAEMSQTPGNAPVVNDIRDQYYGQEYSYDLEDGSSSGVAKYEPVGSKENPLVQPVFVNVERLMAPDEENYMEKPFGEAFFPGPGVTYSRVSVKNIERINDQNTPSTADDIVLKKHATGHVVTEFFTSKDYPTIVDQTPLEVHEDHTGFLMNLLSVNEQKHLTLTQGYVVHLNDMDGKMKSQRVYGEDQSIPISGADYIYDNVTVSAEHSNKGKLDNEVHTLSAAGKHEQNTIGVEYDVINDFREMKSVTEVAGVNGNVATFLIGLIPGVVPVPLPDYARHEDQLRMAVTTKVINTFGVQREVIAYDAGASVSTKNLLWDEATGEVLLTETVNEYNKKYYSFNYPAYWYYSGMGQASANAGASLFFTQTNGQNSTGTTGVLYNGDEVLITEISFSGGLPVISTNNTYAWADNVSGGGFDLMDENGQLITNLVNGNMYLLKVIRSGRRNLQATSMGSIVAQKNPRDMIPVGGTMNSSFMVGSTPGSKQVVNAGAVEFDGNWPLECECEIEAGQVVNPYRYNTKGVYRAKQSHLYLTGRNQTSASPDPRKDGFYDSFAPFYRFNGFFWTKNTNNWTSTSQVTRFSQFGVEIENKDALNRYSAAQYGYNYMFPLAVGANTRYNEMGFDGFEDYYFEGCPENEHFGFRDIIDPDVDITDQESHTGRHSLKVAANTRFDKNFYIDCPPCAPNITPIGVADGDDLSGANVTIGVFTLSNTQFMQITWDGTPVPFSVTPTPDPGKYLITVLNGALSVGTHDLAITVENECGQNVVELELTK